MASLVASGEHERRSPELLDSVTLVFALSLLNFSSSTSVSIPSFTSICLDVKVAYLTKSSLKLYLDFGPLP